VSEKRRLILQGCEKWKGHWMRVYFTNGADFRVKAGELKEMVEKNQLNLNLVKNVEVDDDYLKFKPYPALEWKPTYHGEQLSSEGTSSSDGKTDSEKKVFEILVVVFVILAAVGFFLRR